MTLFVVSVAVVLLVWALCSVSEAALYAVRRPYLRQIAEQGDRAGSVLLRYKDNMERPIAAILIVNTVASAAGAAYAGAQIRLLYGEAALAWFSIAFTLGALFLSEIIPKIVGVAYSRSISRAVALPWLAVILLMYPVIWLIESLSRFLKPQRVFSAPEEEVHQLAMISAEEGSIMPYEAELVRNVLHLDKVTTREIMTPRSVVMTLPSDLTLRQIAERIKEYTFSRIPVYDCADPEIWKGMVLSRDILSGLAQDQFDRSVESLCSPIYFVREETPGHVLLQTFLARRTHLFGVTNERGDITGIVTLEDVIESVIGQEIVDESDFAVDMQRLAELRQGKPPRGGSSPPDDPQQGQRSRG